MNTIVKYLKALFLSALILVTGSGYTMNKMECSRNGKPEISFCSPDDCCSESSATACGVKRNCCRTISTHFQAAPCVSIKKTGARENPVTFLKGALSLYDNPFKIACHPSGMIPIYSDPFPPNDGLLLMNSLLRI